MTAFMIVFYLMLFVLVVLFLIKGLHRVREGEAMVIERLGKFHKILRPGISFILPIIDEPREILYMYRYERRDGEAEMRKTWTDRIDLRQIQYDYPEQHVITKDNVVVTIDALLIYHIVDPRRALYEVANLPVVMEGLTQTTLRNVVGSMDLDETLSSRQIINEKIKQALDNSTKLWGVEVGLVEIKEIKPTDDSVHTMELQMRAEREKRADILKAKGRKEASVLESEGYKDSTIKRAEGDKMAKLQEAEAEAVAHIRIAQAEREAIKNIEEAVASTGGDPLNYLIATRYIDALKEMANGKNTKVVYLPYEATNLLGSLGGIKELFKDGDINGGFPRINRDE